MKTGFPFTTLKVLSGLCKMLFLGLLFFNANPMMGQSESGKLASGAIIESFAQDYLQDRHFTQDWTFGVQVDKDEWTVKAIAKTAESPASIKVLEGFPEQATFYFKTTELALQDVANGKMNALTGAVKAFSTDYAPFDLEVMEGYQPQENFVGQVLPLMFHFWTKGTPEIIPFGAQHTRATHGAQASIFYYQPGMRSGWGILYPGQHANEHPSSKSNPFPSLMIITKGLVTAHLDGKVQEIEAGNAIFIPPGMQHEFFNKQETPVEFILLMFGDGA